MWNGANDSVSIFQEIEFVKAYLALQKYRFGERLSYQIELDDTLQDVSDSKAQSGDFCGECLCTWNRKETVAGLGVCKSILRNRDRSIWK